ncbi:hypothetical protein RvY_15357 [Ramazzottius varieornatus]|uniref:rRNA methyltransferase 2, mitochondrial n=1 Tax=Ramazzottius varieornatus TaxID=947166 RepID=A0A1D1W2N0_RAMVA|nr:hypothetical protein RvY_15357 [Ramazzottius varieornatus]
MRLSSRLLSVVELWSFHESRTADCKSACIASHRHFRLLNLAPSRSKSSHEWLLRQSKDPYVKKAKAVSYRARSAFKLLEIDEKYKILQPGHVVIDLGAAPGSWSQVAVKKVNAYIPPDITKDTREALMVKVERTDNGIFEYVDEEVPEGNTKKASCGIVIGVDLLDITPYPGAIFLKDSDFTNPKVQKKILDMLEGRPVDVVLSDMAPNASGMRTLDHDAIITLCTEALIFAVRVLREKGTFLCKIWSGGSNKDFESLLKKHFTLVKFVKPPASRDDSAETYFLATGFRKEGREPKEK